MKTIYFLFLSCILTFGIIACKNDKSGSDESQKSNQDASPQNDSKALEGTGASDLSKTYKLDQTQIVQPGNVAFNFKSFNSLKVYIKYDQEGQLNFDENEVFAIFAENTIKETSFKVESLDTKGEMPVLNVKTVVSTKTVPEYRPSYVVSIPKKDVKGIPVIRLDGVEIPVFGME